ncbi:hypothetical protein WJX72_005163 [[Myrmecia] bisecta]|uniref:Enoyl reductase (ER) domain-containing protein n=1 Tax=[Myrmecia] bisecta TaxID=41462 RepID=A0AAW1R6H1_9CHLO
MPATQTAIEIMERDPQGFSGLRLRKDKPVPEPKQGEVLVRAYLRPINPTDIFSIQKTYPANPPLPAVPGVEGVAKVERNGPGASKFKEGQRVVAAPWPTFQGEGTWQQYVAMAEKHLVAVPESLSDQAAAQAFVNPTTAVGLLAIAGVPENEYLLQTAATSVLGRMVIRYAKHKGIKTINIVRNAKQVTELKALGANELVISSTENVVDRVKQITGGKGAYAAIDAVSGELAQQVFSSLRDQGSQFEYGALSGDTVTLKIMDLLCFRKVLKGFLLHHWLETLGDKREETLNHVMNLLENQILKPATGKEFPLEKYLDALKAHTDPKREGKVFLSG